MCQPSVLLEGGTSVPGTVTHKVGTPTPSHQSLRPCHHRSGGRGLRERPEVFSSDVYVSMSLPVSQSGGVGRNVAEASARCGTHTTLLTAVSLCFTTLYQHKSSPLYNSEMPCVTARKWTKPYCLLPRGHTGHTSYGYILYNVV